MAPRAREVLVARARADVQWCWDSRCQRKTPSIAAAQVQVQPGVPRALRRMAAVQTRVVVQARAA